MSDDHHYTCDQCRSFPALTIDAVGTVWCERCWQHAADDATARGILAPVGFAIVFVVTVLDGAADSGPVPMGRAFLSLCDPGMIRSWATRLGRPLPPLPPSYPP